MPYDYYSEQLSGERLARCYELAPPRVRRYLKAEIDHVVSRTPRHATVLELGCGYGRVLEPLSEVADIACGIDTSLDSLRLARQRLGHLSNIILVAMDASLLGLTAGVFDVVCCVQNGISSFHLDQRTLIESALAMVGPRGRVLFSSYADEFWNDRLEWFRIQSAHGLIGEIDEKATGDGTIVCRDGFTATTVNPQRFQELTCGLEGTVLIHVIDGSSVFCEILKGATSHGDAS